MTRTRCILINNSFYDLKVAIPTGESKQFRGSDLTWKKDDGTYDVLAEGTIIPIGGTVDVGGIGDPGWADPNQWGWIYFWSEREQKYIQLYIFSSGNNKLHKCSLGYYDKSSSGDNPQPQGMLCSASCKYDKDTNITTATYTYG